MPFMNARSSAPPFVSPVKTLPLFICSWPVHGPLIQSDTAFASGATCTTKSSIVTLTTCFFVTLSGPRSLVTICARGVPPSTDRTGTGEPSRTSVDVSTPPRLMPPAGPRTCAALTIGGRVAAAAIHAPIAARRAHRPAAMPVLMPGLRLLGMGRLLHLRELDPRGRAAVGRGARSAEPHREQPSRRPPLGDELRLQRRGALVRQRLARRRVGPGVRVHLDEVDLVRRLERLRDPLHDRVRVGHQLRAVGRP